MYKKMPQVTKYVDARLEGKNKAESAIHAGYSATVANKPSLIELTNRYSMVIQEVLHDNSVSMREVMRHYNKVVQSDPVDWEKAKKIIDVAEKQAKVYDILMPKVTLKESTDKNGNVTRTAWAQNASQVQEVMTDVQDTE